MGNKLKQYIKNLRAFLEREEEIKDVEAFKQELFREIQFWQHERLIHLLVTMLFALLTMSVLLVMVFQASIALLVLFFMLLVLLVPYIRHYYIMENGVQTLYVIYEEVCRRNSTEAVPGACIPEEYGIKIKPFSSENEK